MLKATNTQLEWIDGFQVWLTQEESLNNAQLVANYFTSWDDKAISAMCGNMRIESSINPNMYEFGYEWEDNRGYGLVQWTPRSKYWDWAVSNSLVPENGNSQLARIQYEIDNGIQWIANGHALRYGKEDKYNFSFEDFSQNNGDYTVAQLTEAFMWNYEGPDYEAGQTSLAERILFAEWVHSLLDFSGSVPSREIPEHWLVILGRQTNMRRR